jgi:NADH-quinone oxidoreductase subunit G
LAPSPLIPFFWSPGWNSIQAVNKYQQEVGGSLRNEQAGQLLFSYKPDATPMYFKDVPEAFMVRNEKWLLLPQYHVFGSEELSMYAKGVRELSPEPYIALSVSDAAKQGWENGQTIAITVFEQAYELPVKIDNTLQNGIALIPAGLPGMPLMNWNSYVYIMRP